MAKSTPNQKPYFFEDYSLVSGGISSGYFVFVDNDQTINENYSDDPVITSWFDD